jgi:hypothetical protein
MAPHAELWRITTDIPARMDRLPWVRWHWLIVIGLGTVWILDGRRISSSVGSPHAARPGLLTAAPERQLGHGHADGEQQDERLDVVGIGRPRGCRTGASGTGRTPVDDTATTTRTRTTTEVAALSLSRTRLSSAATIDGTAAFATSQPR